MPEESTAKKQVWARIDPVALDRLEEMSAKRDRTVSYLINAAVVAYVQAQNCEAAE